MYEKYSGIWFTKKYRYWRRLVNRYQYEKIAYIDIDRDTDLIIGGFLKTFT